MIMPQWFVAALLLVATAGMVFNVIFLLFTLLKERKNKAIW